MQIHEIIRTRRTALGLTQEQLAGKLGVSAPAVNKWERAGSYPDITLLPVLANLPKLAGNHYALMELEPFRDLRNGYGNAARQLSLNVVMTVPFGFLWPLVRRKRGLCRAVLAALLLSLCIELLQPLLTTGGCGLFIISDMCRVFS